MRRAQKRPFNYDRYVNTVWGLLFLVFAVRHSFQMNFFEGLLLSGLYIGIAYPLTSYLTKKLLRRAIARRRIVLFVFQFILFSLLFAIAIPVTTFGFYFLEKAGVFPHSGYFDYIAAKANAPIDDYIGGFMAMFMFNFGFCGLWFFETNLKMREELARSRLQMLQAQINPHFMFNVLNHVHVLIRKEPQLADTLLLQYTDILRYQLYSGDKDSIVISQEVRFLKNFIDVEAVRWKNKLDIESRWEIEDPDMEIPPLLFITFVENAFKHVSRCGTRKGYVNITLIQTGRTIRFEVENSNDTGAMSPKKEDSGIGLANIRRRLNILFPEKYTLHVTHDDTRYATKLTIYG